MKMKPYYRTTPCQKCRNRRQCEAATNTPWRYDSAGNVYENGDFRFNDKVLRRRYTIKATIIAIIFAFIGLSFLFGQLFVSFSAELIDAESTSEQINTNKSVIEENDWNGLELSYVKNLFPVASDWINYEGQCGEYAGAMMLSINDSLHDELYEATNGDDNASILEEMKSCAGTVGSGTSTVGLAGELTQVASSQAHVYIVPAVLVPTFIDHGYSVALLLVPDIANNKYGNHCVCAYAYARENGSIYYRVCDNWGSYNAVVDGGCIMAAVVVM